MQGGVREVEGTGSPGSACRQGSPRQENNL